MGVPVPVPVPVQVPAPVPLPFAECGGLALAVVSSCATGGTGSALAASAQ